jgi:hypothetical protein
VVRPPKRRKTITNLVPDDIFSSGPEFHLRLLSKHLGQLGLSNPILISLEKVSYIRFNSEAASYLFYISSCLFEVPSKHLNIYYSANGATLSDDSSAWATVEETDDIKPGVYLLEFEDDAGNPPCILPPPTPILHHYSNLILAPNINFVKVKSRQRTDSAVDQTTSKASGSRISTPAQSTSIPATPTAPNKKSKCKVANVILDKPERVNIDDEKIRTTKRQSKSTPSEYLVLLYSIPELIPGPNSIQCRLQR